MTKQNNERYQDNNPRQDNNPWIVAKFGGTSVSSKESVTNIAKIVTGYLGKGDKVLLVVSALSGVSNLLEKLTEGATPEQAKSLISSIEQKHRAFLDSLELVDDKLSDYLDEVLGKINQLAFELGPQPKESAVALKAQLMSLGEQLSSRFLQHYLTIQLSHSVSLTDARLWLRANSEENRSLHDQFMNAECQSEFDSNKRAQLDALGSVIITQGFVASDLQDNTVVLGRGGSDTSAAYFASLINARQLDIWTDVPGMFSANPRQIPEARQLLKLDYREAQEIASTGAKVLHPSCLRPVRQAKIPVFIGSTFAPEKGGTLVGNFAQAEPQVKAISVCNGVTIVAMETADMWRTPGFLAEAFGIFNQQGLSIDQVSTSETNVTITLDNLTQSLSSERLQQLTEKLSAICRVTVLENCASVSIVGSSIRTLLAQLSHAFEAFQNRSVHMLTQAANNLNFTFVLDQNEAPQLIRQIHNTLISEHSISEQIGKSWQQIFEPPIESLASELLPQAGSSWWHKQSAELEQIAQENGACYVYSMAKLQSQIDQLKRIKAIDRVFYAIKANPHADILSRVEAAGLGFECVSIFEVKHVLALFPHLDPKRILFTPNFAPQHEYIQSIELGVHLTLDNLYLLEQWPEIFAGQSVLLRIDTGTGKGHHQHVKTAGKEAKFGIPINDLIQRLDLFDRNNIQVVGLHCHVGSGILTHDNWRENGIALKQLLEHFKDVKYLDLGGGLGIVEQPQQQALDLAAVDRSLLEFKELIGGIELWLEPGRFVVAECGVLLARVTQLKGKEGAGYLGLETGMNSLIRPALYGAYHPIFNLSRLQQPATEKLTVVGPICETGDKLGIDRLLPVSFEGDVMLIANAGAYGRVMASSYNLREPASERVID